MGTRVGKFNDRAGSDSGYCFTRERAGSRIGSAPAKLEGFPMKAMFIGFAASIVIAIAVGVVMTNINPGSDERFSVPASVRL